MYRNSKSITGRRAVTGLSVKNVTDEGVEIEGYGVLFDVEDVDGDKFSAETDFWFKYIGMEVPRPLMWDHAFDSEGPGLEPIGTVKSIKQDDTGLWFEAVIDRASKYGEMVERLVEMGVIGASSGSTPHMVRYVGQTIKSWPIIELSLTPTPAEPGTVGGFDTVKSALRKVGVTGTIKAVEGVVLDKPTGGSANLGDAPASAEPTADPSTVESTESEILARLKLERAHLDLSETEDDENQDEGSDQG